MTVPRAIVPAIVEAALSNDALVPPPASASIGAGPTAALRAAMARFSSGSDHATRRRDVEIALEPLGEVDVRTIATAATTRRLSASTCEAFQHIGLVVPTMALGEALGVEPIDLPDLVVDVRTIVEVIGRGHPATAQSDEATTRLRNRFSDHPGGADATVSVLYQNHDATAALVASKLVARQLDAERRTALVKTVRAATAALTVGPHRLERGDLLELSLEDRALEFGAGEHRCPGEALARQIADGIVDALSDWRLDVGTMQTDSTNRATTLPMNRVA